jgi:Tripartite tricarboxylate transporter TctB family
VHDLLDAMPDVPVDVVGCRTAEIAAWIVGMLVAIWLVGFGAATLLTTFLYLKLGAREQWGVSVALSLGGFVFVYGLFERALGVPFPPGSLLVWLGYA